jgi:transcriptional regulator GlxA family with amidase domain
MSSIQLGVLLFPGFELLDVCGPLEVFGYAEGLSSTLVAAERGPVASTQGPALLADCALAAAPPFDWLMVPGGLGARAAVDDAALLAWLTERAAACDRVLSVCTGSALLARAGCLDGRRATTNKRSFGWATAQGPAVDWVAHARWVVDGPFFTSSGVSAGIDMALAVVADVRGEAAAAAIAERIEYEWHRDPTWDPFAALHGLVDRGDG